MDIQYVIIELIQNIMTTFKKEKEPIFRKAIKEYGFFKGTILGFKRVIKCNPWSKGGYDELKPNIKGKIKWIL